MPDVVVIGTGRVAAHLAQALQRSGITVRQLCGRSEKSTRVLAHRLNVPFTTDLTTIASDADFYLLAVSDDAIATVSRQLAGILPAEALLVHTSGATPLRAIGDHFQRAGIFYPLQTFSTDRPVDFTDLPICLSARRPEDLILLQKMARRISNRVATIDDRQRAELHLAAVFVNNFTNHLFGIAASILKAQDLSFELLIPLIRETVAKIETLPPESMQTGPALRGDRATISRHLELLQAYPPQYTDIYRVISNSINPDLDLKP